MCTARHAKGLLHLVLFVLLSDSPAAAAAAAGWQATNSRRTYGLLFDWIYPSHMPLLLRAVEAWADTPDVTTPVLKFMAEFVLNKTQRLTFDSSC